MERVDIQAQGMAAAVNAQGMAAAAPIQGMPATATAQATSAQSQANTVQAAAAQAQATPSSAQNVRTRGTTGRDTQNTSRVPFQVDKSIPGFTIDRDAISFSRVAESNIERSKNKIALIIAGVVAVVLVGFGTYFVSTRTGGHTEDINDIAVVTEDVGERTMPAEVLDASGLTQEEKAAIQCALKELSYIPYSRKAMIDELTNEYNGYSESVAETAVQYLEDSSLVIWQDEAVRWAQQLLENSGFSRVEMINMLSGDYQAYTDEEVEYAINYLEENGLVDWNEQAKIVAEEYLELDMKFDRQDMIDQLMMGNDFTLDQAEYAVNELHMR